MPAYSQVDNTFGLNTKGFRVSAGIGFTKLVTHYNNNPFIAAFVASGGYDFNPYFSAGFEGQIGTLQGIDGTPPKFYYASSTNAFKTVNFNLKVGVGLFTDFHPDNGLQDALKRTYFGIGYGVIKNDIVFSRDGSLAGVAYKDPQPYGYLPTIPFSVGTNIGLINVLGYDRLEINPEYKLTFINSVYSDGFISNANSHLKGFYDLVSVSLRYKF